MSVMQSPASIGSIGIANPELATSFRRAQWRMLLAAMFCYLFFYTGRQTFGFAIPGIQAEFGVSACTGSPGCAKALADVQTDAAAAHHLVERPALSLKRLVQPRPRESRDEALAEPAPAAPNAAS